MCKIYFFDWKFANPWKFPAAKFSWVTLCGEEEKSLNIIGFLDVLGLPPALQNGLILFQEQL